MASKKSKREEDLEPLDETHLEDEAPSGIIIPGGAGTPEDLDTLRRERDEYLTAAQRARADYVNLERRMNSQFAAARDDAQARLALEVLSVLDDLERALEHAGEGGEGGEGSRGGRGEDYAGLVQGVALVRDKFVAVLERFGIKRIEALGRPFDHNYHAAVAQQPTDEAEAGTVVAVAQMGYCMGEKLLRAARVVVAGPVEGKEADEDPGE